MTSCTGALGVPTGQRDELRPSDGQPHSATLTIRHTLDRKTRTLAPTKTEHSHRTIHLPARALAALREQRRRQLTAQMAARRRWCDTGLAFTSAVGTAMDVRAVIREYHNAADAIGLPRRPFHHLRHFAATTALEAGADLYTVSRMLGHASITTTADIYGHITPAMARRTADLMDAALG